jgi:four helix bundle protein
MASFKSFEDFEAWRGARQISRSVYQMTNEGAFARDFGLRDQTRRAAVSVMANIAEGFGRGGNREFVLFLGNARGSLSELQSHLYVAIDAGLITREAADVLFKQAKTVESQISALIRYLRRSELRGPRLNVEP